MPGFYVYPVDTNKGPHAWTAGSLLAETSPQPLWKTLHFCPVSVDINTGTVAGQAVYLKGRGCLADVPPHNYGSFLRLLLAWLSLEGIGG